MEIDISRQDDIPIVRVAGRVDAAMASEFEQQCAAALAGGARSLVLDLAGVRYISSAGLRGVLATGQALAARGGKLHVAGLAGIVREIFEISGFHHLFPQHSSVEAAVAACKSNSSS
jgi:anti-anti-sigma factor